MGVKTVKTYSCDRCDCKQNVESGPDAPLGGPVNWATTTLTMPVNAGPNDRGVVRMLCPSCVKSYHRWLLGRPTAGLGSEIQIDYGP